MIYRSKERVQRFEMRSVLIFQRTYEDCDWNSSPIENSGDIRSGVLVPGVPACMA
uniref:Uncharacterized protein n=1 Tax=Anguilla anguilla TaxID=7936 RepID=A0A0E9W7U8_ANGAN